MNDPISFSEQIKSIAKSDPLSFFAVVVVLIGFIIYEPVHALSTFSGITFMILCYLLYSKFTTTNTNNSNIKAKSTNTKSSSSSSSSSTIKNIWEAGKSSITGTNSTIKQNAKYSDKPFGSKYYYAHNNPGATGGYKDGLKMEDYRMNGPRLLSKGGAPVADENETSTSTTTETSSETSAQQQQQQASTSTSSASSTTSWNSSSISITDPNVIPITKYLWDDPGDHTTGIATIRIDTLPTTANAATTEYIDWKDASVTSDSIIESKLVGEGLIVKFQDASTNKKYQLKIAKLYGDANDIKLVIKPKRLLVKIIKKKIATLSAASSSNSSNNNKSKSNLDAWPQPYRKI